MVGIYHLYKRKQRKGRFTSCRGEKKRKGKKEKVNKKKIPIYKMQKRFFFIHKQSYNYEE
jgi:hypothetical protein